MTGRPVRITILAEHVPALRDDVRIMLGIEATVLAESQSGTRHDREARYITEAALEASRLIGVLSELGFDRRPRERDVTLTGTAGFLAEHFTKQLSGHEAFLRDLTAGGERPDDIDELLEVHTAIRHALAQIPGHAVAA